MVAGLCLVIFQAVQAEICRADMETVAACLVLEAGGEPTGGMEAVMSVIDNRSRHSPALYASVVLKPHQFSSMSNGMDYAIERAKDMRKHGTQFERAMRIVSLAASGSLPDATNGAMYFCIGRPSWSYKMDLVAEIGHHKFWRAR